MNKNIEQVRMDVAARSRYDPLLFSELAWAWGRGPLADMEIRAWQSEVMDTIANHLSNPETRHDVLRLAVASGHGVGKSALTGMLITWALSCWDAPRVVITANTESQLRRKTSPEVQQWVKSSLFADLFQVETLSIQYRGSKQHRADFETNSAHNAEAFAGLHARGRMVMMIVDEASGLSPIIYETILGALTDEETVLIVVLMGNPTSPVGPFREAFSKNRHMWNCWNLDSRFVEGTNKAALNNIIREYGEDSDTAKVRVRGIFPNLAHRQLISTAYVDQAYGRFLREAAFSFAPVIIGCDMAWEGDDDLVMFLRQGLFSKILHVQSKNSNDLDVAAKLAEFERKYKADAVFIDEGGFGTGVLSAGRTMGKNWRGVYFGAKPDNEMYTNKRAEMYGRIRDWMYHGGSIPKDQGLYEEIMSIETDPTIDGKVKLRSKHDMKKNGQRSPNKADALALTFAYDVIKKMPENAYERPRAEAYSGFRGGIGPRSGYTRFRMK